MIAAGELAAVGRMIAVYRRSDGAATDYEIARVTVELRDLRVKNETWARIDPAHQGCAPAAVDRRGSAGAARVRGGARVPARLGEQSLASGDGACRDTYRLSARLRCSRKERRRMRLTAAGDAKGQIARTGLSGVAVSLRG